MWLHNAKRMAWGLVLLTFAALPSSGFAAEESEDDFFHMSLDELAEQPYEVVSASRQKQTQSELSIPVTVITAEDIHYSGLTSIPNLLRFYLGVDVLQYDRNRYGVGVRGLHDSTSDRTLVLINGRNCTNPAFGGMEWEKFPVLMEDIDRIEIVRGPGGAAWGANAFNGVINIITKRPQDVLGFWGSTTITEFGDSYSHLRYGASKDPWAYRISAGYLDQETSDDAGAGRYVSGNAAITSIPSVGFSSFQTKDFSRNWFFDSEFIFRQSDQTQWTAGASYASTDTGSYELIAYFPKETITTNWTRLFTRVDHTFEKGITGYIQWFGNYYITHSPVLTDRYATYENDLEAQIDWKANEAHSVSMGGNLRWLRVDVDPEDPQSINMVGNPVNEEWAGLFLIDRFKFSERITLEGQIRGDWYSGTDLDWSARFTTLYSMDEANKHVLRLSTAKAFRAPSAGFRKTYNSRVPLGGPVYAINYGLPLKDLENEETWSIEAGYHGELDDTLTLRIDTYYQQYEDLIGSVTQGGVTRLANLNGAKGYGAECEIAKRLGSSKLSAWYAYNGLETDQANQSIRSSYPTRFKSGLTFRHKLDNNWVFNANYVYNDNMKTYGTVLSNSIDTFNRLDLTLSAPMLEGRGELMVGVVDVFNKTHDAIFSSGTLTAHDVPGRMFFGRFQYHF